MTEDRDRITKYLEAFRRCWKWVDEIDSPRKNGVLVKIRIYQRKGHYSFGVSIQCGGPDHEGMSHPCKGHPYIYPSKEGAVVGASDYIKGFVNRSPAHTGYARDRDTIFALLPVNDGQMSLF